MASTATQIQLTLVPAGRFDAIDVTRRVESDYGDLLRRHGKSLYCSYHTTAGYLERGVAARLLHHRERLVQFVRGFATLFPPDAAYRHDRLDERLELSEEQRRVEPKNADSHLTFIGSGMRNCVTYRNQPQAPVYFVDLDGVHEGGVRRRTTSVLAYDEEQLAARVLLEVPVSRHLIDSVNLAEPRLGLLEAVDELLARTGVEMGRVDIALASSEREAGLTVNEYETLLMQHDLAEVLRDPLKFAALKGRHALDDPLAIPGKTLNYARYDVVRVFNSLLEAFHADESFVERFVARVMAVPARRFVRSRRVSFLASDTGQGKARLVRGTYQSPILLQWAAPERGSRVLEISLVRLS